MKQFLIVVGVVALIVAVTVVAAYFGQAKSGSVIVDKGQRFTAKPGTTRENAIALTSNKRPSTKSPEESIARKADEMEDDAPLTVKSLSSSADERSGPAHDKAMEAMNSGSPESGLRMLNEALALPHDPQQAAYIQEAMGQLYAQLEPPDFEKSQAAFDEARSLAKGDPKLEQSILLKSVQVLMQQGMDDEARIQMETGFTAADLSNQTQLQLHLLQGKLEERAGHPEAAEQVYQEVLDAALALPESIDREMALDLARLAALRLTGLYRSQNRDEAADGLAQDMKRRLKAMESPA